MLRYNKVYIWEIFGTNDMICHVHVYQTIADKRESSL